MGLDAQNYHLLLYRVLLGMGQILFRPEIPFGRVPTVPEQHLDLLQFAASPAYKTPIVFGHLWHRLTIRRPITQGARHSSPAAIARAGMIAFSGPRFLRMVLAYPTRFPANRAFHTSVLHQLADARPLDHILRRARGRRPGFQGFQSDTVNHRRPLHFDLNPNSVIRRLL